MNLYSSTADRQAYTHRRTHTRNKHNKNSSKKGEKRDQYSDLKIRLKWSRSISLSINLLFINSFYLFKENTYSLQILNARQELYSKV